MKVKTDYNQKFDEDFKNFLEDDDQTQLALPNQNGANIYIIKEQPAKTQSSNVKINLRERAEGSSADLSGIQTDLRGFFDSYDKKITSRYDFNINFPGSSSSGSSGLNTQAQSTNQSSAGGNAKNFFHGNLYQLYLLIFTAHKAQEKDFILYSEHPEHEKFDDLVIDYKEKNRITFLQAKHAYKPGEEYKKSDLCEDSSGAASLAKYFDSWLKLKARYPDHKELRFIFFTNKGIEKSGEILEPLIGLHDDEFSELQKERGQTLKFRTGEPREDFIKAIREHSQNLGNGICAKVSQTSNKFKRAQEKAAKWLAENVTPEIKPISITKRSGFKQKPQQKKEKLSDTAKVVIKLAQINDRFKGSFAKKIERILKNKSQSKHYDARLKNIKENKEEFFQKINIDIDLKMVFELCDANKKDELRELCNDAINQFLDEFILKIEQPNYESVQKEIQEKLEMQIEIGTVEAYNALERYMLEWFVKADKYSLSSDKFIDNFKGIMSDPERFYLLTSTDQFQQHNKFQDNIYLQGLQLHIPELMEFLKPKEGEGLDGGLAILQGQGVRVQIDQTIKSLNFKIDEWGFVDKNCEYFEKIATILGGRIIKFLVIDCREFQQGNLEQISQWKNVAATKNKKLVLINLKDPEQLFEDQEELVKCTTTVEPLNIDELTHACQGCNENYLNIAGRPVQVDKILKSENGIREKMRDLDLLHEILSDASKEKITQSSKVLPHDIYIPNNLLEGQPYYTLYSILTASDVNLIILDNIDDFEALKIQCENWFNQTDNGIQKNQFLTKVEFNKLNQEDEKQVVQYLLIQKWCNVRRHSDKKKIYVNHNPDLDLKALNDLKVLRISKIPHTTSNSNHNFLLQEATEGCSLPAIEDYYFDPTTSSSDLTTELTKKVFEPEKFSVLAAPAGFGKSSFCLNLYLYKEIKQFKWIVYINLPQIKVSTELTIENILTHKVTSFTWPKWQTEALINDMEEEGRVLLLLDSFDEVKNSDVREQLNKWFGEIPIATSVLITTRPYAFQKIVIPNHRGLDRLKLMEYDDQQKEEYFARYFGKILEKQRIENLDEIQDTVFLQAKQFLDSRELSIIGVPLESYILCSTIKPYLITALTKNKEISENFLEDIFGDFNSLNLAILYQKFINTKLHLFLEKQMKIMIPIDKDTSYRLYALMDNYIKILKIYAFKQALSLTDKFIDKAFRTQNVYIKPEMIEDLKEAGLANIEEKAYETYHFSFNHETYQEYLAAVFLMEEFKSPKFISKAKQAEILFDPKYRMILKFIAQFSIQGDPLLHFFDSKDLSDVTIFWKILGESQDILGVASEQLYKACINEALKNKKKKLIKIIKPYDWSEDLIKSIEGRSKLEKVLFKNLGNSDEADKNAESSVEFQKPALPERQIMGVDIPVEVNILKNKTQVVSYTKELLNQGVNLAELAAKFEEVVKTQAAIYCEGERYVRGAHYNCWDIDGGFEAMSLLGEDLTETLADYFIENITRNSSWRVQPAINALYKIYSNNIFTRANLKILWAIIKKSDDHQIQNLIFANSSKILSILIKQFVQEFKSISFLEILGEKDYAQLEKDLKELTNLSFELLKFILWIMIEIPYAILTENRSVKFIHEDAFEISLEDVSDFHFDIFQIFIKNISSKLKYKPIDQNNPLINTISNEKPVIYCLDKKCEHEKFQEFCKNKLSNKSYVRDETVEMLNSGIDPDYLASLFKDMIKPGQRGQDNIWGYNGELAEVFNALSLLGAHFTQDLAGYFIRMIKDNPSYKAKSAFVALNHNLYSKGIFTVESVSILPVLIECKEYLPIKELINLIDILSNEILENAHSNIGEDNRPLIVKILQGFHKVFDEIPSSKRDKQYQTAVDAYNDCIKADIFKGEALEAILPNTGDKRAAPESDESTGSSSKSNGAPAVKRANRGVSPEKDEPLEPSESDGSTPEQSDEVGVSGESSDSFMDTDGL